MHCPIILPHNNASHNHRHRNIFYCKISSQSCRTALVVAVLLPGLSIDLLCFCARSPLPPNKERSNWQPMQRIEQQEQFICPLRTNSHKHDNHHNLSHRNGWDTAYHQHFLVVLLQLFTLSLSQSLTLFLVQRLSSQSLLQPPQPPEPLTSK